MDISPVGEVVERIISRLPPPSSSLDETPSPQETQEQRTFRWAIEHGVPPRFARATLEGVGVTVRSKVGAYCLTLDEMIRAGRGLLLLGSLGVGKSCILGVVARAGLRFWGEAPWASPSLLYADCGELTRALIRRDLSERASELRKVPLLLLDEMGSEYDSEYGRAALDEFLRWRHAYERATCVASNISAKLLAEDPRWQRTYDRLRDTCIGIELGGASRRQAK